MGERGGGKTQGDCTSVEQVQAKHAAEASDRDRQGRGRIHSSDIAEGRSSNPYRASRPKQTTGRSHRRQRCIKASAVRSLKADPKAKKPTKHDINPAATPTGKNRMRGLKVESSQSQKEGKEHRSRGAPTLSSKSHTRGSQEQLSDPIDTSSVSFSTSQQPGLLTIQASVKCVL